MPPLIAPLFFLTAGLLVVAGASKVWLPRPTAQALYAAGLPASDLAVRGLGVVEMVVGILALVRPAPWVAVLVALLYLGFACFVGFLLLARPSATSCGCAGARETRPSWLHVSVNVAAVAVAVIAAIDGVPSVATTATSLGAMTVPAVAGLIVAGWLTIVVVTEVPASMQAWTTPDHHQQELFDPDRHRRADVALSTAGVAVGHPSLWPDHDPVTGSPLDDHPPDGADVGL